MLNNVYLKSVEKLNNYIDNEIEITRMWHLKETTLLGVIGDLEMISKGENKYVDQIPGRPEICELQLNHTYECFTHFA